jgi:hypothetical protein
MISWHTDHFCSLFYYLINAEYNITGVFDITKYDILTDSLNKNKEINKQKNNFSSTYSSCGIFNPNLTAYKNREVTRFKRLFLIMRFPQERKLLDEDIYFISTINLSVCDVFLTLCSHISVHCFCWKWQCPISSSHCQILTAGIGVFSRENQILLEAVKMAQTGSSSSASFSNANYHNADVPRSSVILRTDSGFLSGHKPTTPQYHVFIWQHGRSGGPAGQLPGRRTIMGAKKSPE